MRIKVYIVIHNIQNQEDKTNIVLGKTIMKSMAGKYQQEIHHKILIIMNITQL